MCVASAAAVVVNFAWANVFLNLYRARGTVDTH